MKRQIFTALSLTLLISSPLTLNAGRGKKKKQPQVFSLAHLQTDVDSLSASPISSSSSASSATDIPALALAAAPASSASASLPADFSFEYAMLPTVNSASSTQPDEFAPKDTAPQRAALFAAILAIEHKKNKGLKRIDAFHELKRQDVIRDLYKSESHAIIPTKPAETQTLEIAPVAQPIDLTEREQRFAAKYVIAQWRLNVANKHLAKIKEELAASKEGKVLDLFPSSPTLPASHDDIASLFQELPATVEPQQLAQQPQQQGQQQTEDDFVKVEGQTPTPSSSSSSSASAPTPTPVAPAAGGGWLGLGWLLGSKN